MNNNIAFNTTLFCITILTGCATSPHNTTTDAGQSTLTEKVLKKPSTNIRIYPYKLAPTIKAVPIAITPEPIIEPITNNKITKPNSKSKTSIKPVPSQSAIAKPNNTTHKVNTDTNKLRIKQNRTKPSIASIRPTKPIIQPVTPVVALLQQAENQRTAGDLVKAASTLERGVRIEPHNPHLWNKLARIRLEQGLFSQAHSMATKSNTMAGSSKQLIQENQNIITEASKRSSH